MTAMGSDDRLKRAQFTLSAASSRAPSPAPSLPEDTVKHVYITDTSAYLSPLAEDGPGRQADDVYEATLGPWRAGIRKKIVARVRWESEVLARMQNALRTPWLDAYFVYSSTLGTHTFFLVFLPIFFFFGYDETGRGLLMVLAFGVYASSFLKDLLCSPRPFAPPTTRLTIGSHHLEYGFPSTHSTNSVSIALFLYSQLQKQVAEGVVSESLSTMLTVVLTTYAISIVYGRLYTAMHSFSDVICGVLLGTLIWYLYVSGLGDTVEVWARTGGWAVPLTIVPLGLLAVNQHPQPTDNCVCFEDAIAFGSVVAGMLLGSWAVGYSHRSRFTDLVMPGSGWVLSDSSEWIQIDRTWLDVGAWWGVAATKVVVGILIIFIWRLVAKFLLLNLFPPLFRLLSRVFSLPNRRYYIPATDYTSVPSLGDGGLHPIPSVIDLHLHDGGVGLEVGGIGSGTKSAVLHEANGDAKVRRRVEPGELEKKGKIESINTETLETENFRESKHYDADVLTKVIVYAGISFLGVEIMPMLFDAVGWGTRSWPP